MGYSLSIGELEIDFINDDEDEPLIDMSVERVSHPDAPAFGEPTDHQNQRWPSYSSWHDFARYSGLYEMFFGKNDGGELVRDDALLGSHPGCVPITERHRREVNAALSAWKEKHPKAVPTYGKSAPENIKGIERMNWSDPDNPEENWKMTRLVWLHYWINWALDNCERPVFCNT